MSTRRRSIAIRRLESVSQKRSCMDRDTQQVAGISAVDPTQRAV